MRTGSMISGSGPHAPTVYTVLARSARSHSRRYLTVEAMLAWLAAGIVLARQPHWWPVASLALAVALYASWGLLARADPGRDGARWPRLVQVALATIATAAVLAGLGGLAVKAFWGTAPGPYGVCYGSDGVSYPCHADGSRRPAPRPPA